MVTAATEIQMPRLSDSMAEGTVLRWLKAPGDAVARGEALVEIETDKAEMVHESDVDGVLAELLATEGETVAVGTPIARMEGGDGTAGAPATAAPAAGPSRAAATLETPARPRKAGRVKASPLARRLARESGVDLLSLSGSGPRGRIVKRDVLAVAAGTAGAATASAAPAAKGADGARGAVETVPANRTQATVARRMAAATATVPHFQLAAEIDMTRCVEGRHRLAATAPDGAPSINDMVVKACGLALREHPAANASWTGEGFARYARVNVGIAVAAPTGLLVPTVFDADLKSLGAIAAETRRLAERVRAGAIEPAELDGATFTVSNLGMHGVDSFEAVIAPPQAAILAVGAVAERPVARNGALAVAPTMWATLACDHRVLNGADGAALLARIRALLEEPLGLAG